MSVKTLPAPQTKIAPRMSGEDRRQQILDVAIRLFSQKGFRGTTTREIALTAGVNESIIFRHFATKQELYTAIIDRMACTDELHALESEVEAAVQKRDDRGVFETIARHILDHHDKDDSLMRLIFYSALEGHELCHIFFRNQASKRHRQVADYIKQRIHEGAFRKTDPITAARSFFGMVLYHAQINLMYGRDRSGNPLNISNKVAAERFTEIFLNSLQLPSGKSKRCLLGNVLRRK